MEQTVPTPNKPSKKRLIIFLFTIIIVIILAVLTLNNLRSGKSIIQLPGQEKKTTAETRLSFVPNTLYANPNQKVAADIVFDAADSPTNSLTLSVTYDPSKIKDVKITPYKDPNSALSYSLVALPEVQTSSAGGLTNTTYKFISQGAPQKGRGIVAKFEGTLISAPTDINFDQTSNATSSESSTNLSVGMVNLNIFPNTN
jgi:hypothetical protein